MASAEDTLSHPPAASIGSSRLIGLATIAAWVALAAIAVGIGVSLWPVRNGDVQDCGTPLAFVLTGRQDAAPTAGPGGTPPSAAEIERALDHPCRERVAARMVPAALIWLGGILLGFGALVATMIGRRRLRRRIQPATMDEHG